MSATRLAAAQHAAWQRLFAYELAWRTPVANLGAYSGLDFGFVFDTLGAGAQMAGEGAPAQLATELHVEGVRFAVDDTPGWHPRTPDDQAVMTFDAGSHLTRGSSGRRARPLVLIPTPIGDLIHVPPSVLSWSSRTS